ncbi:vomeronasal type-2 receptor 26-like [Spea bombifrons]|uniref:vomeronasal type-2 receptor 26-like n=1 Tax=Spea bombifrons TaxID=233779 RepID=UPI00234BB22F|nr:vomeronasal type-2 receptor 26-like [Spea bombifrons]
MLHLHYISSRMQPMASPCVGLYTAECYGRSRSLSGSQSSPPACHLESRISLEDYEYVQDGDIIIGGVFRVNNLMNDYREDGIITMMACMEPIPHFYKNLLTFMFAIGEINSHPEMLPNITLGYHLFDSCSNEKKTVKSVLQILSGPGKTVPNYSCTKRGTLAGFIGDELSDTTIPMAQILGLYGYAQISYGATHSVLSDRRVYPTFFRTVQNEHVSYYILSKLLKYFGWNWVGILTTDDESGDKESQVLTKYMKDDGICAEYVIKIHYFQSMVESFEYAFKTIERSSSQVIIFCGSFSEAFMFIIRETKHSLINKYVILGTTWSSNTFLFRHFSDVFNGTLTLKAYYSDHVPKLSFFLEKFHPKSYPNDKLLEDLWVTAFECLSPDPYKNQYYEIHFGMSLRNCTGRERLNDIVSFFNNGDASRVNNAVLAMAKALHNMYIFQEKKLYRNKITHYKHQLHHYIRNLKAEDQTSHLYFDENGEHVTPHVIRNWVGNKEEIKSFKVVGVFDPWAPADQQLNIKPGLITWKNEANQIPKSQCSENCLPGYRKAPGSEIHFCCYDCVLCSEGEISNMTDSEACTKCPDNEWPNEKKDLCVPKLEDFLSYDDAVAIAFTSLSILFCLLTVTVSGIFVSYKNTPVVKANNWSLSMILLVSIMTSFLCVFLFLGRPTDITCILRQTVFGVAFSLAVSSVLAKTIMIFVAFKATKPGSVWRKCLGIKLSASVVLFGSSVQVIIIIFWLSISPPFQELDMHSYQGKIIVQCNEGSVIAFYCVLGYMGLLAAVSFIIAFLARTLPDSFNEAKYITFSMLVFCSVWIAMIPAYLSTKGKNMVAVEIFAIVASSAGLLGCIFFAKCYIIIFRPEINSKTQLFRSRNNNP